ncbi:MAG: hypothetical protein JXA60_10855 [Candidatus Coatesbacteria bacterium]|nr:hypothetical protein [Candidatus Coatesbacteria bacterium]
MACCGMIDDKRKSIFKFLFLIMTFGTTGFFNLFMISLLKPKWFPLFFKVIKFFAGLPFKLNREKIDILQDFYIINPSYRCKASAYFFSTNPALAGFIYKYFNLLVAVSFLIIASGIVTGVYFIVK